MQEYTKDFLENVCKNSFSYAEVLRKSGRKPTGGNYEILKNKIILYEIDISHFTGKLWNKGKDKNKDNRICGSEKYKFEEIFTINSHISRKVVRSYIIRHEIIKYECEICGNNGVWMNKNISLELDHIDGDIHNNEIDNLRFLCPNCHATTSTYRGKNKKNKNILV